MEKGEESKAVVNRGPATSHLIIGLSTLSARPCRGQPFSVFWPRILCVCPEVAKGWRSYWTGVFESLGYQILKKEKEFQAAQTPLDGARKPELSERN